MKGQRNLKMNDFASQKTIAYDLYIIFIGVRNALI